MTPSEIAFLGVGLVIGAALGAAIIEALRARPAPRRQIRLTISPNTVAPRRSATLADPVAEAGGSPIPGSPDDAAWPDSTPALDPAPPGMRPAAPGDPAPGRTRVPSGPIGVPASAVAVPVERWPSPTTAGGGPTGPAGGTQALASAATIATAVAVLDPVAPLTSEEQSRIAILESSPMASPAPGVAPAVLPSTLDVGAPAPGVAVRPRPPVSEPRPTLAAAAVPVAGLAVLATAEGSQDAGPAAPPDGTPLAGSPGIAADPCAGQRTLVDERCSLASAARDHAKRAADDLREAQRAYDVLRERLDQAQASADPRELAAAKDELHRRFRLANEAASGAEAAEAAAREWLSSINDLNAKAREAARFLDAGGAELRAAMPRLDRLAVEADAARISAENAELGCNEARERLAACEEQAERAAREAAATPPEEPHPFDAMWPAEHEPTFGESGLEEPAPIDPDAHPAILRMLRGDRAVRDRIVAGLAAGDADGIRDWQLRLAALLDAITARAIEAGYLDLPDSDRFWGMFEHRERRDIVGALSALGFRFDGLGGFADARVPAARDLSLAVGYAGLDRMRIRAWPQEAELASLYEHATVAADEWLAEQADDLALGRMVDALGPRAAELADIWNAWGRLRPALLATD